MATMIVTFKVADYGRWRRVFDRMDAERSAHGITAATVHRHVDDPDTVVTILSARSMADARAWADSATLRAAMAEAGVEGRPAVVFLDDAG